jgi:pimeloyl-ACP methyl ester carboxylesterase
MLKKILLTTLVLLAVLVFLIYLRPNHIISKSEAKAIAVQPSSKFTTWKDNEIHYTDEGEGPVVLMIHGFGGSFYNFQAISQQLKDSFRVIRVDVPGSGLSDFAQSGSEGIQYFEEFRDFFHTFIDELGIDSFYVMGNSLGGLMASLIAEEAPDKVKGLILLNSAGYDFEKVIVKGAGPVRFNWFRHFIQRGTPEFVVRFMVTYPFADKSRFDESELPIDYALVNREGNLKCLHDMATSRQFPDTTRLQQIKVPTLIVWGGEDVIIPVEHVLKFERDIPNSRVKIYSPCGHMPMMEIPDSIAVDFRRFVREI